MTYKTVYHESERAVRTWDWFNEGRIVEPKSFCQFWRTVLMYATIKWTLSPVQWFERVMPRIPFPRFLGPLILLPIKGCWLLLRWGVRFLWFLLHPVRRGSKPVNRAVLAAAVSLGEPIQAFGQRHKVGLERFGIGFLIVFYGGGLVLLVVFAFLASWFLTLVIGGGVIVGSFTVYGFFKSGTLGLLWGAAVVTHDVVCPPITILRGGAFDERA